MGSDKLSDKLSNILLLGFNIDVTARYTAKRILKSGNRMIVFWEDGTKTVVKRAEDEADSDYAAFTAALGIKLYGSNSALKRIVSMATVQKPKKEREDV